MRRQIAKLTTNRLGKCQKRKEKELKIWKEVSYLHDLMLRYWVAKSCLSSNPMWSLSSLLLHHKIPIEKSQIPSIKALHSPIIIHPLVVITNHKKKPFIIIPLQMASKISSTTSLLLLLNLLFFTMVTSTYVPCPPPPQKHPKGVPSKQPTPQPKCPKDTLKLGVCADLLDGLVRVVIGTPPKTPCCTLIKDLVDLEAALCLCTAVKAKALGLNIDLSVSLSLLLNYCGKKVPNGFKCPA